MSGREALRVAAVYHNYMDHDHALAWHQKGYDLLKEVTPRNFDVLNQFSTAYTKLAREAGYRQDWDAYKKYSAEYRQVLDSLLQAEIHKLSDVQRQQLELKQLYSLLDEAKMCLRTGEFAASEKLYHSIEKWIIQLPNLVLGYRKVAFEELHISILIYGGQLSTAEKIARENVQSTLLYRGEKFKDYLSCLEVLADVLMREEKNAETLSVYEKILICLQNDYPYEQQWIETTLDKIQTVHARAIFSQAHIT